MISKQTIRVCAVLLAIALASSSMAFGGTIVGKITYDGRVPNFPPLKMGADPKCEAKHSGAVKPETLVLGADQALANVFVMITDGLGGKSFDVPSEPVVMDQNGCIYTPHVMGVQVGQQFKVKNSDGLLHNVHSLSKDNPPFNRAMPANVTEADYEFAKTERFRIKCDVHPWMGSWVTVVDHPFYAVTGTDGSFRIENVPAGTYTIEARHEVERFGDGGALTETVTVGASDTQTLNFVFQGPQ